MGLMNDPLFKGINFPRFSNNPIMTGGTNPTMPNQPWLGPPSITNPGFGSGNPSAGPDINALRNAFQQQFILGDPSSDLSNPQVQNSAASAFQNIINQLGGDPNLRGSIGDAAFINRLQEFIGKGTTLDQSGIINIGNGVTMNSLRDLGDFNQPFVPGVGGHNPGQPTGMSAPFGFNRLGNPRQVQGRRDFGPSGTGSGSFSAGSNARFPGLAGGVMNNLASTLNNIFRQPRGLSDDALQRQQNLINTSAAQREQQGLSNLQAVFNTAGQVGGGQFGRQASQFSTGIDAAVAEQTAQLAMANEQLAQQQLQSAISGALGLGGLSNQFALGQGQLGLQRDLGFADLGLRRDLGMGDLDLRRMLGLGQLNLGQGQLGLQNQQWLSDLALQEWIINSGLFGLGGR